MRDRLQRQVTQRTEMLAGVSHDLRTPLTRMRLALELMEEDASVAELKSDVTAMQRMVQGYLDFARGEGEESARDTDIVMLVNELISSIQRDGPPIFVALPERYVLPLRADATRRCLANLVGNARRYGKHIWVTAIAVRDGFDVTVDDDGPGHSRRATRKRLPAVLSPRCGAQSEYRRLGPWPDHRARSGARPRRRRDAGGFTARRPARPPASARLTAA